MYKGVLERYWEDIPARVPGIVLKVLQTITMDAPGSSRLRRELHWTNDDEVERYDRSVVLFLYTDDEKRDAGADKPQRSLANLAPKRMYGWHDLTGRPAGFDFSDDRFRQFVKRRNALNGPVTDLIDWEEARPGSADEEAREKVERHWFEALSSQFQSGDWTCWVSLRLNAQTGLSKDIMCATAYAVVSGAPGTDSRIKLAKALYELLAEETIEVHEAEIVGHAKRAAVNKVMARCLSHNIGSHVLTSLTNPEHFITLAKEHTRVSSDRNHRFKCFTDYSAAEDHDRAFMINSEAGSIDQQLASFNRYLRTRMDFLAGIATGGAPFSSGMWLSEDLLQRFTRVDLVRRSIPGLSSKELTAAVNIFGLASRGGDIKVAVPSDDQGAHALFIILENMVRNSAKHGGPTATKIHLHAELIPDASTPDLIAIDLFDAMDEKVEKELIDLVTKQNVRIANRMLMEDGSVRPGSWGMLEMKIAAALLRGLDPANIDEAPKDDPNCPLLVAHSCKTKITEVELPGKHHLRYRLYLQRYREALFVLSDEQFTTLKSSAAFEGELSVIHRENGFSITSPTGLSKWAGNMSHAIAIVSCDVSLPASAPLPKRRICLALNDLTSSNAPGLDTALFNASEAGMAAYLSQVVLLDRSLKVTYTEDSEPRTVGCMTYGTGQLIEAEYVRHPKTFREGAFFESFPSNHPLSKELDGLGGWAGIVKIRAAMHFAEARLLPIAVVDERIQKEARTLMEASLTGSPRSYADMLAASGIDMPTAFDLNSRDLAEKREDLTKWIDGRLNCNGFVIIHMGILERVEGWANATDKDKVGLLSEWLAARRAPMPPGCIVFTSGRSRPEFLDKGEAFISYSLLARYTLEYRSKYHLTKLLFACHAPRIGNSHV